MNKKIKRVPGFTAMVCMLYSLMLLFSTSCTKNSDSSMGSDYITSQAGYQLIDTLSVSLSTIIIDTLESASSGSILLGHYSDETFGGISCSSFFQLGVPSAIDIEQDDTYDSLALVLTYNKYAYGDTTLEQKIWVHQLAEIINTEDSLITNETTFEYNPNPIGSLVYTPRPKNPVDTLSIKIDDTIGIDLYNKLLEESSTVTSLSEFVDYFKGLTLIADEAYPGCIIGFNGDVGEVKLSLFTTRKSYDTEHLVHEFTLNNASRQFNHITHDFSATQLSSLVSQENALPGSETDGLAYIYGGIGLAIRVDFPSLGDILFLDRGKILKATLSLAPQKESYNEYELPSQIYIYEADILNNYDYEGSLYTSYQYLDKLYHEETYYTFDLTGYITDEISDSYIDPNRGLLVTLLADNLVAQFDRLIIDGNNKRTNLKIYYLSY